MIPNEAELAAYLDERDHRLYSRLLLNRMVQGTVMAVNLKVTPYQVQVRRTGETAVDGNWYACPAFAPQVGDTVELVWRDDSIAYALLLLSRAAPYNRFRVRAHATSTTSIVNVGALNAFTGIVLNTVDDDPNGDFSTAGSTYTPKQAGEYRVSWGAGVAPTTATVLLVSLFKNSSEYRRAMGYVGAGAFELNVGLSTKVFMNGTTDFLNIAAVQNSGGNLTTVNSAYDQPFFTAELVSTP